MTLRLPDDPAMNSMDPMLEMAWRQVLRAAHIVEWSAARMNRFMVPERITEVAVPGHVLVGAADSGGTIADADGLDLEALVERKSETGSVAEDDQDPTAVLDLSCDLLIPAALQGVIDQATAERLGASMVLEGANGPCTWAGAEVLRSRGIPVVPDILANSGGVSASYEEMTDPSEHDGDDVIAKRLDDRLRRSCDDVWDVAESENLDYRSAATVVALRTWEAP